jgi:hypothetical protein
MDLFFGKVSYGNCCFDTRIKSNLLGLAYSPLPKLVHAHARHILVNPTQHRPGIDLLPHQLIANKMVGLEFDFPIIFFSILTLQPSP